jgi:hypothetical protein
MPGLPLALALLLAGPFVAQAPERVTGAGPGLNGGIGYQHHGVGVQAAYYQPLPLERLFLTPRLAFGRFDGNEQTHYGLAGGLSLIYGQRLRVVADLGLGAVRGERLVLHGTEVGRRAARGLFGGAGIEFAHDSGLLMRGMIALARPYDARLTSRDLTASADVSLGYKLW